MLYVWTQAHNLRSFHSNDNSFEWMLYSETSNHAWAICDSYRDPTAGNIYSLKPPNILSPLYDAKTISKKRHLFYKEENIKYAI